MQPSSTRPIHAHRQGTGRAGDRDVINRLQLARRPLKSEHAEVVLADRIRRQLVRGRRRRGRQPIKKFADLGIDLDHATDSTGSALVVRVEGPAQRYFSRRSGRKAAGHAVVRAPSPPRPRRVRGGVRGVAGLRQPAAPAPGGLGPVSTAATPCGGACRPRIGRRLSRCCRPSSPTEATRSRSATSRSPDKAHRGSGVPCNPTPSTHRRMRVDGNAARSSRSACSSSGSTTPCSTSPCRRCRRTSRPRARRCSGSSTLICSPSPASC